MSGRLLTPLEAGDRVAARVTREWAEAVCAEVDGADPYQAVVRLRPGVGTGAAVARLGFGAWHDWTQSWHAVAAARLPGVGVGSTRIAVERVPDDVAAELVITGLDAALAFVRHVGAQPPPVELSRARAVAARLRAAGATLTPATLRSVCRLSDVDVEVLTGVVAWLADHPDVSAWTARQVPVPAMHSKWLETHGGLLRDVSGRDLRDEVRPRLAVVHLTYVDPGYLATGRRRHDAWTTGDVHELAYTPRTVVVVENRDCRLWFPPAEGALVVEGGGKAAAALLSDISWVRQAQNLVYWGDIDADGFAILDHFRRALAVPACCGSPARAVSSILMDAAALRRYAALGVRVDKDGRPIPPSSAHLPNLTRDETTAYHAVATAGEAELRRVEQERIPGEDVLAALAAVAPI